jgi:integrase
MALSDTAIRKAQTGEKLVKLTDGNGLQLWLMPTGGKLWRFAYRFDGKQRTLSLGAYPDVSLSQAREKRELARKQVAAGIDPSAQKQADKVARKVATEFSFESVARRWYEQWKVTKADRHAGYVIARLEADVFPAIGARPITDIEAPDLVRLVKAIEARGALDIAKRCLQMTGQIFRYAIAHGEGGATRNPATDIRPADILQSRQKTNYARIDAKELPTLLRKIEGYQGTTVTRLAIQLMALTFVRTGELINARWDEFDLDQARWDIPAARMKMRTPHIVPLSTHAVQVLRVLNDISGHRDILFPGERDHDKPMSNNTILKAIERMGYKGQMTGHGFRGLASTILHEQGYDHAHIELQLAHQERNAVSAAYNHALYLPQRAKMMQEWGDYLDGVRRGNVVPLRRLAA